jgi:hypothetical protein
MLLIARELGGAVQEPKIILAIALIVTLYLLLIAIYEIESWVIVGLSFFLRN